MGEAGTPNFIIPGVKLGFGVIWEGITEGPCKWWTASPMTSCCGSADEAAMVFLAAD